MSPDHLRLLVFSDLHGKWFKEAARLIDETRPDWIVLCGDLLPDFAIIGGRMSRLEAQRDFWRTYRSTFLRPFAVTTFVRGNHELEGFRDPLLERVPPGLEDQVVRLEGIPVEFGGWGWSREWEEEDLERELRTQLERAPQPSLYLSHVPPWGYLDRTASGENIGHRPLLAHLRQRQWPRALVLCGHVHEAAGSKGRGKTLIVNAACGYALVDWNRGNPTLLRQGGLQNLVVRGSD